MNDTIGNIRLKIWEDFYPGCTEDFLEIFGTNVPDIKDVTDWKMSWNVKTPYKMVITNRSAAGLVLDDTTRPEIETLCRSLGIHPYFWDFIIEKENVKSSDIADGDNINAGILLVKPTMCFFKEEHNVMFKLAWH